MVYFLIKIELSSPPLPTPVRSNSSLGQIGALYLIPLTSNLSVRSITSSLLVRYVHLALGLNPSFPSCFTVNLHVLLLWGRKHPYLSLQCVFPPTMACSLHVLFQVSLQSTTNGGFFSADISSSVISNFSRILFIDVVLLSVGSCCSSVSPRYS